MRHMKSLTATAAALILTAGLAHAQQSVPMPSSPAPSGAPTQPLPSAGAAVSGKLDAATLIEVKDDKAMVPGLNVSADDLEDFDIYGSDGKKIGEVEKVLADGTNTIKAVTVEVGGFLGMGSREAVISLDRLQKGTEAKRLQTSMTKDEIEKLDAWTVRSDTTIRK